MHDFDLLQMLLGPLDVYEAQLLANHSQIIDAASVSLRSKESVKVTVEVDWFSPQRKRELEWFTPEASVYLDFISQTCRIVGRDLSDISSRLDLSCERFDTYQQISIPVRAQDALARQLEAFLQLLNGEKHGLAVADELVGPVAMVEKAHALGHLLDKKKIGVLSLTGLNL